MALEPVDVHHAFALFFFLLRSYAQCENNGKGTRFNLNWYWADRSEVKFFEFVENALKVGAALNSKGCWGKNCSVLRKAGS